MAGGQLFALAGLAADLLGFALVLAASGVRTNGSPWRLLLVVAFGILPLPLLAASLQLLLSTVCRGVKEAQTYLSMLVFLPMGLGMFLVFFPGAVRSWCRLLPVVGQQLQMELWMRGKEIPPFQPIVLGLLTVILAMLVLLVATDRLHRDEVVYGN